MRKSKHIARDLRNVRRTEKCGHRENCHLPVLQLHQQFLKRLFKTSSLLVVKLSSPLINQKSDKHVGWSMRTKQKRVEALLGTRGGSKQAVHVPAITCSDCRARGASHRLGAETDAAMYANSGQTSRVISSTCARDGGSVNRAVEGALCSSNARRANRDMSHFHLLLSGGRHSEDRRGCNRK